MKNEKSAKRKAWNAGIKILICFCSLLTAAVLVFILGYIFVRGAPHITRQLLTTETSYLKKKIGILPNILNTLYIIPLTMAIVLPIGVGSAIYLNEYAKNKRLVAAIEFASEILSGIPSIIFGLAGMLIFNQFFGIKQGILAGSLTLVMMVLPTVLRTSQESLKAVPDSLREGSLALGAGKFHMIKSVVLPNAKNGIITGCILSAGRIAGESAALLFTCGFGLVINDFVHALTSSSATLTVALYVYASERGETDIAFAIAAILVIITLALNFLAGLFEQKTDKKKL